MAYKTLATKFIQYTPFHGLPKLDDFRLMEELLRANLYNGEILLKGIWHSVDPYMLITSELMRNGSTMPGSQIAKVVRTNNPLYPEGTLVVGNFGWRDYTIYRPTSVPTFDTMYKLPDMRGLPHSYALGTVGMPGNTAYFGFTRICEPKDGCTVVVASATGAVGSVFAQIAKVKGCKVLAFAPTTDKMKWLKDDLGFDLVFNYNTANIAETFQKFAPHGIDCCFDSLGGTFTHDVLKNMNPFGRIAICGGSNFTTAKTRQYPLMPMDYNSLISKQIRIEGFTVSRWANEWFEGLYQLRDWVAEGKIKVHVTAMQGFKSMPEAFIEMLKGKHNGKMVVKANEFV